MLKKVKMKVIVTQSCPTVCDPMDCSLPGSSVHGIFQARILEWVAIPFSRGSSWPRDQTWDSCIAGRFFTVWDTSEAPGKCAHRGKTMWGHSGKAAIRKPRRANPASTLMMNFQPPELWERSSLLFSPLNLWYFVTAAGVDERNLGPWESRGWWDQRVAGGHCKQREKINK